MATRLTVDVGPEWRRAEAALRQIEKDIPKNARDRIIRTSERLAGTARKRVRRLPTPSHAGHTGLRRRVARGVAVTPRSDGALADVSMIDPSEAIIPWGLDHLAGWRHPVFGNRNVWVRQRGYSWFEDTFENSEDMVKDQIAEVLEDAAQYVARQGGAA